MDKLLQILETTISQNPVDQEIALNFLRIASEENYEQFVQELARVLCNVQNVPYVRQAAGLQLKNTLVARESELKDFYSIRWLSVSQEVRTFVKNCVLETLGTETKPSTAAQCVAAISFIELPTNNWPDVIDKLKNNVISEKNSEALKESSLEALGYICQDMPSNIMEDKTNAILTAIVHGMRENEASRNVRLAATKALFNSLEFTRNNFKDSVERNIIMEVTCTASVSSDNSIKVIALQCLVKIMSLYYQFMEPYMKTALFPITLQAMKDDIADVSLQGIEFWSNVCEEELNLAIEMEEAKEQGSAPLNVSKHYAKGALIYILPILTQKLVTQDENDDDDEWIPSKAAGVCIMLLAQCCGDKIVEAVLPFIDENFVNENWHYREAAIMAFGSIMDGPSKQCLNLLVEKAIYHLVQTLTDSHAAVKDTAAWAIGRVCDTCEILVTRQDILSMLLPSLSTALRDQPRVAANVCWAISSLVKAAYQIAIDQGNTETFILSPVFEGMINELLNTTDRSDAGTANLRIAAYEALMQLIKNSPNDCYPVVQKTTLTILDKLENLISIEDSIVSTFDHSQLRDLQSQLCAILQSVLQKIKKEDAPLIAGKIMNGLLQILHRCFSKDGGGVIEEALMAVTCLINDLETDFFVYLKDFKDYLFHALDLHEDTQVCITAIGVVSDLYRVFEEQIFFLTNEIMQKLIAILENGKAKRILKTHVLYCFGDIALAINDKFVPYLDQCVTWLNAAVNAAIIVNPDDYEQLDYVGDLLENCCGAYSSITQSFRHNSRIIYPYIDTMLLLLKKVTDVLPKAPETVNLAAFGLIGDLFETFGSLMLPLIDLPCYTTLLNRCQMIKSKKSSLVVKFVLKNIEHAKQQAKVA